MATKVISLHKKLILSIGAVALGALIAACSSDSEPAPFETAGTSSLTAALEARTGSHIVTVSDGATAKPYGYLAADAGKPIVPPGATAADLRAFVSSLGPSLELEERLDAFPIRGEIRERAARWFASSKWSRAHKFRCSTRPWSLASVKTAHSPTWRTIPFWASPDSMRPTLDVDGVTKLAKGRGTPEAGGERGNFVRHALERGLRNGCLSCEPIRVGTANDDDDDGPDTVRQSPPGDPEPSEPFCAEMSSRAAHACATRKRSKGTQRKRIPRRERGATERNRGRAPSFS